MLKRKSILSEMSPRSSGMPLPYFPVDCANIKRAREAADDETNACTHANARGSRYQSKWCPACGAQLMRDVDPDEAAFEERFREAKRVAMSPEMQNRWGSDQDRKIRPR